MTLKARKTAFSDGFFGKRAFFLLFRKFK